MSEAYSLIILPEAQEDMRKISQYIAQELAAPAAALKLQDALLDAIHSLSVMPKRIRTVMDAPWKQIGVRRMRVKNYYLYFLVDDEEKTVKIMAVISIHRDQARQMMERAAIWS